MPTPTVYIPPRALLDQAERDGTFSIRGATWDYYEDILAEIGNDHYFVTYDEGVLDIMAPSHKHDDGKKLTARMLEAMVFELEIDIRSCGSATWKREDIGKGIEPDECYYIQHEKDVRHKKHNVDLQSDPPPDLAIEIDVSRNWKRRKHVYAGLGIPELWCWRNGRIEFFTLDSSGDYQTGAKSRSFPFLRADDINRFLELQGSESENAIVRAFLKHVKTLVKK